MRRDPVGRNFSKFAISECIRNTLMRYMDNLELKNEKVYYSLRALLIFKNSGTYNEDWYRSKRELIKKGLDKNSV